MVRNRLARCARRVATGAPAARRAASPMSRSKASRRWPPLRLRSGELFTVKDGKVHVFNCYPSVFVMLWQLGVLPDLKGNLKTLHRGNASRAA